MDGEFIDTGFMATERSAELRIVSVGEGVEVRVGRNVVADTTYPKAMRLRDWIDRYGDEMYRLGRESRDGDGRR